MPMEKEIYQISINDIIPNRFQPRLSFDDKAMEELTLSIKEHGIIQPLVLRKLGNKYEIIAGERRYKASIRAGLEKVPAIIMNLDDNISAEVALVENVQRKDLSPLEEAKSYQQLLDRGYLTQEELAKKIGKDQSTISNKLRLLSLPNEVHDALLTGKISERHARSLLSLKTSNQQLDMLTNIMNNRLTVRQTDEAIKDILDQNSDEEKVINLMSNPIFPNIISNEKEDKQTFNQEKEQDMFPRFNEPNLNFQMPNIEPIENIENKDINPTLIETPTIADLFKPKENQPTVQPEEEKKFYNVGLMENEAPNMVMDNIVKEEPIYAKEAINEMPFIPNFNNEENTIETPIIPNVESVENKIDLKEAITKIRLAKEELEKLGFNIDIEEFDFESIYQMIIKIKK